MTPLLLDFFSMDPRNNRLLEGRGTKRKRTKKMWKKTHLSFRSAEITTTQKYPKKIAKNEREGKKTKTKWFRGFNFFPDFCSYRACVKSAILLCQQRGKKQKKKTKQLMNNIPCI